MVMGMVVVVIQLILNATLDTQCAVMEHVVGHALGFSQTFQFYCPKSVEKVCRSDCGEDGDAYAEYYYYYYYHISRVAFLGICRFFLMGRRNS